MIPDFDENSNLLPGIHDATMAEVKAKFVYNEKRKQLFNGLERVVSILCECKCPVVFLNGSFITKKDEPGDYDLCYESTGIIATERFYRFLKTRASRKEEYLVDIFIRMPVPPYFIDYVETWQTDTRQDDLHKGILRIDLRQEDDAQE